VVDVVVVVVDEVLAQRVSWYCVTPGALYWFSRFLASVWTQQPAELPPVASQSTATHCALATHAARQASRVVTAASRVANAELTPTNDRHGTHSPDAVTVVARPHTSTTTHHEMT